jgi:hypothetical protein
MGQTWRPYLCTEEHGKEYYRERKYVSNLFCTAVNVVLNDRPHLEIPLNYVGQQFL